MKKNLIYISMIAAGVMMMAGCAKESIPETAQTGEITLSASLPSQTKTAVDGTLNTKVNWTSGDKISIWGGENYEFTLSAGAGAVKGTFSGTMTTGAAEYALYPYSETASNDAGVITTSVPSVQTATAGSFDPAAAIMVGTISSTTITFNHAVAFLKITAPTEVTNLASITITANSGIQLTGDAKFAAADGAFTATGKAYSSVTVKPNGGTFEASKVYYAAVIPGTYSTGLTISYLYKDGSAHTAVEKSKSSSTSLTMAAGHTKVISAVDMGSGTVTERNAVQLWENGPYWAEFNVGATITNYGSLTVGADATPWRTPDATLQAIYNTANCGGLYPWHNSTLNGRTTPFDGSVTTGIHDVATALWGGIWREPTASQLQTLVYGDTSTTLGLVWTWCDGSTTKYCDGCTLAGYKVSGKVGTAYESNGIFLPAEGYFDYRGGVVGSADYDGALSGVGESGGCWASKAYGSDYAYCLSLQSDHHYLSIHYHGDGKSVRAVLVD